MPKLSRISTVGLGPFLIYSPQSSVILSGRIERRIKDLRGRQEDWNPVPRMAGADGTASAPAGSRADCSAHAGLDGTDPSCPYPYLWSKNRNRQPPALCSHGCCFLALPISSSFW